MPYMRSGGDRRLRAQENEVSERLYPRRRKVWAATRFPPKSAGAVSHSAPRTIGKEPSR